MPRNKSPRPEPAPDTTAATVRIPSVPGGGYIDLNKTDLASWNPLLGGFCPPNALLTNPLAGVTDEDTKPLTREEMIREILELRKTR
jgi:hypothetical protein